MKFAIVFMLSTDAQTTVDICNVTVNPQSVEDVVVLVCNLIAAFTSEGGECNNIQEF